MSKAKQRTCWAFGCALAERSALAQHAACSLHEQLLSPHAQRAGLVRGRLLLARARQTA